MYICLYIYYIYIILLYITLYITYIYKYIYIYIYMYIYIFTQVHELGNWEGALFSWLYIYTMSIFASVRFEHCLCCGSLMIIYLYIYMYIHH